MTLKEKYYCNENMYLDIFLLYYLLKIVWKTLTFLVSCYYLFSQMFTYTLLLLLLVKLFSFPDGLQGVFI